MLLYSKKLLEASKHVFTIMCDSGDIKSQQDIELLLSFSTLLQRSIYHADVADSVMPVEIDSIGFSMYRIRAVRDTFVKAKLVDAGKYWERKMLENFALKVHKSLFD